MAATINFGTGRLAVIETWAKGEERINILRSYGECPEVTIGHYVLDIPGQPIVSKDVSELRQAAASQGYTYRAGNPKIVEAVLIHQSVEVLWWKHNLASRQSFIREMNVGSSRPRLDENDLVVLSMAGKRSGSEHGHWVLYYAASRAELDKAHPRCRLCLGTGASGSHLCSCIHGRVYWGVQFNTLKEVRLDRYEVVAVNRRRYASEPMDGEVLAKFVSPEEAAVYAARFASQPRFQPGYELGYGEVRVGIRVREVPLPTWA